MNPAMVHLFPTVMQLLEEASKTDFGKKIMEKGKRAIQVSLPYVEGVSKVTVDFLSTNVGKELFGDVKSIKLSKNLDVVERGLSLPSTFDKNQAMSIEKKISEGFEVVKGQNEILFLSNSINYFIDSHRTRVGIDRNISHALQYDVISVGKYLQKRNEIRFPGYLLHQIKSLSSTISELNVFYDSICKDGYVSEFKEEELVRELTQTVGVEKDANPLQDYYPCDMKLRVERRLLKENGDASNKLFSGAIKRITERDDFDGVYDVLMVLKDELLANERLEQQIEKKLKVLPGAKLMIESN
ncbi:hypothetical protein [Oceanisphaera psychrotolerans]|uniref:Uncharacterized protein n=1 Tax=Oceanisphaera psychrotolerans TaxID=1414654 RepID=A0A1J4QFR0_9GAMM|nr:hypothetical protein [Oceanisphaera psychrotolerans]OIN12336.1 hypothetical protein BFR47_01195 [Oceanisphaera psychrotolerans]